MVVTPIVVQWQHHDLVMIDHIMNLVSYSPIHCCAVLIMMVMLMVIDALVMVYHCYSHPHHRYSHDPMWRYHRPIYRLVQGLVARDEWISQHLQIQDLFTYAQCIIRSQNSQTERVGTDAYHMVQDQMLVIAML